MLVLCRTIVRITKIVAVRGAGPIPEVKDTAQPSLERERVEPRADFLLLNHHRRLRNHGESPEHLGMFVGQVGLSGAR